MACGCGAVKTAKNAVEAASRVVKNIVQKKTVVVSKETKTARLEFCLAPCEYLTEDQRRCNECGCYISLKTNLSTEECPRGYWPSLS